MGKNHHKKDYKIIRAVCLWLHDFTCYSCKKVNHECETHHLNKDSRINTLFNLVPLCFKCHKMWHRIPIQPQLSKKNIVVLLLKKITQFS